MIYFPVSAEEVSAFFKDRNTPVHIAYDTNKHQTADTLSLSKLNSILVYEPEEMIVSVQAGITLAQLEKELSVRGQWLPMLVADEVPELTLGGAIEIDHHHPRSASMGMLRTGILGGTFCTTDGEIFKSGSRVVKSVAGYDIHRAFCGSKGLFGAIISVTLKVQPKPEQFFRFATSSNNLDQLLRYSPSVCEVIERDVVVELAGYSEDIEYDIRSMAEANIILKELDQSQWLEAIRLIRLGHSQPAILDETVKELLLNVRKVFDPKGLLV